MRRCNSCGELCEPEAFYSGETRCKSCCRERRRRYYYDNLGTEREKARARHAMDREASRRNSARYFAENLEAQRARKRAYYRIKQYGHAGEIPDRNLRETWVYLLCDDSQQVLYVGISVNPDRRLAEHSKRAAWWSDVKGIALHRCDDRRSAMAMEAEMIRLHMPVHNVALKPKTDEVPT